MLDIQKINKKFYAAGETILRLRWLNIALFFLLIAVAAFGLKHIKAETDMESWFLEDDQLLEVKQRFEDIFGNDEFCGVLIEADNVFSPKVLQGIRELGIELKQKVPYADDVISLADVEYISGTEEGINIGQLVPEDIPEGAKELAAIHDKAMAKAAMKNRLVSEDGRYTWLMLRLKPLPKDWSEKGEETPELVIGRIAHEVAEQDKYAFLNPKLTGLPVIAHDKMAYFGEATPKLMGGALCITMLVLGLFLRNVRGVIFPFITLVGGLVIVFGFQGYLGISMDPSMIFVPVFLGIAITTSYSIHLFNFSRREFIATGNRKRSLLSAIEETGWPLLFCALTTMVALFSFMMVPMRPVRWIGLTAAALVGVVYLLVIVMLPTLLSFGKDKKVAIAPAADKEVRAADMVKGHKGVDGLMLWLGDRCLRRPKTVLTIFVLLVAICLTGLTKIDVSFDVRRTYGPGLPYVARISSIADTPVGSLYSYGIAIEFPQPDMAKDPEKLKKFDTLINEVKALPLTKKTTSLLDVIKDMNQVMNNGDPKYYSIPDSREMIAQQLLLYENAGGAEAERWVDYDYQRLRLMVDMSYYNSSEAMRELKFIQKRAKELFPDSHVLLIGSISQYTVMQNYVTEGQIKSFVLALCVITVLMSLVFGSLKLGLIGMIPNVAPALAVAGIMGFADIPLDMMTVTVMPMLLGLAVDDTIHFISHSQLGFQLTGSYQAATRRTFLVVGSAMFYTSLVLVLGFAAFLISPVNVFIHMGVLIGAGILAALLTDYFVTPVLLKQFSVFGKEKKQKKPFILKRFYPYMGEKKKLLPLALFFSGAAAICNVVPFILIWLIIRNILVSGEGFTVTQVQPYLYGIGGCVILGVVLYFLALTCSHLAAFRVEVGLQKAGLERIVAMPLGFFDGTASGKIRKVINDGASTTHGFLAHQLPDLAASWVTPIALLLMIIAVNWRLGLLSLIPVFLGFLIFSTMRTAKGKEFMQRYFDSLEEMSNEAVEYVRGVPVVKTFGQSIFSFKRFYNSIIRYKEYVIDYTMLWKYKMSFFNVILQTTALFLLPATILLLENHANPALLLTDFIFYLIVAPNFMTILMRSAYFGQNVHIAEQAIDRVEELLNYPCIKEAENPQVVADSVLEFRNVTFRYQGAEKNAVDGVSFTVRQGETVALVGASGGGKSTIARLAARFYDVDSGEVLIGGVNVKDISTADLMANVSFVFQNTRLFSRSIRDNLLIGKKDATEEEIARVLELSCSKEIIERLPAGLDTVIGTEGTYLSGGEQQRISLARAMLKNAPVVLLDEATAFTDPENEHLIHKALEELGRGKTTLMIAHRLSSVQNASRILVVENGKIAEEGSHQQLMEQAGLYSRMFAEYEQSINWKLRDAQNKGEPA